MEDERKETGFLDVDGKMICFGDKIKHAVGHEYVISEKNLEQCKRISDASGYEDLGGWKIVD